MLLADVAHRAILVVLFDNRTTLGMVRLKLRSAVDELVRVFDRMFQRPAGESPKASAILGDVDDEIDRLFQ
jgi:hypothetical protein